MRIAYWQIDEKTYTVAGSLFLGATELAEMTSTELALIDAETSAELDRVAGA